MPSYTTRQIRKCENDTKKYKYSSADEFAQLNKDGEIIEHEEYADNLYGTSLSSLAHALENSDVILMHLNIEGANFIRERYPKVIDIYLYVSLEVATKRIASRSTDKEHQKKCLAVVEAQNKERMHYSHVVITREGALKETVKQIEDIILNQESE